MSHKRTWSKSEKLTILDYSKKYTIVDASRKFGISTTSIYKWKERFEKHGEQGLESQSRSRKDFEMSRLERENRELKAIVAEKEMQLRIQAEMLKKSI